MFTLSQFVHFQQTDVFYFLLLADVLSEEVILKWFKDSHSSRGWSVFMDQMKKFVDWLEHAEEGNGDFVHDLCTPRYTGLTQQHY